MPSKALTGLPNSISTIFIVVLSTTFNALTLPMHVMQTGLLIAELQKPLGQFVVKTWNKIT